MALQLGADFENLLTLERAAGHFVQPGNHTKTHRSAAPKSARHRNISGNGAAKPERLAFGAPEKRGGCGADHRDDRPPLAARNCHVVIEAKGDPKAVESGSEIGCARRNSDGDLLHWVISAPGREAQVERDAIVTFRA